MSICYPLNYYANIDLQNFDAIQYMKDKYPGKNISELLQYPEARRRMTKKDPLLFAVIYLSHHLTPEGGTIHDMSFNDFHIETYEWARDKIAHKLGSDDLKRYAFLAPRKAAKSTLFFTILPIWALAHGHKKFVCAIGISPDIAQKQMRTFRSEIDNNDLIRSDFPALCTPAKTSKGNDDKNTQDEYVSEGGFFVAKSIRSQLRGMKIRQYRPDWVLCDEIEEGEGTYTAHKANQILMTVREDIKYLNEEELLTFCGTVTMGGSIMHQIKQSVTEKEYPAWVDADKIVCHSYGAIIDNGDGTYRSLWEQAGGEWRLSEMLPLYLSQEATFMKEKMNDPVGVSNHYWNNDLFKIGEPDALTHFILYVDPAVTTSTRSDQTGLAVIAYSYSLKKAVVLKAYGVRKEGEELRGEVLSLLEQFDRITNVVVESNQGGNTWVHILHDLPGVKLDTKHTKENKEAKFARALGYYQRGDVFHADRFPELETEMRMFPKYKHDDIADAVVMGLHVFFDQFSKPKTQSRPATAISYL